MASRSPYPEYRPEPRRPAPAPAASPEPAFDDDEDDASLIRLVGAVTTALVVLAAAGTLLA